MGLPEPFSITGEKYSGKPAREAGTEWPENTVTSEARESLQRLAVADIRYRRLVELSPEPIAIHVQGLIVYVNPAGLRLVGAKSPAQLLNRPILDFVHPDSQASVITRLGQLGTRTTEPELIEERLLRLDGAPIEVETIAIPITYEGREASQIVIRDITERKRAEAELRASRNQLGVILQGVAEAIVVRDGQGRPVYANQAAVALLGYPNLTTYLAGGGTGNSGDDFFDARGNKVSLEKLCQAPLDERGSQEQLIQMRLRGRRASSTRWFLLRTTPIYDEQRQVEMTVTIWRDVTGQHETEQRLRTQAFRAEALARASKIFTATSLDLSRAVGTVARQLGEVLGDACCVFLVQNNEARVEALYHRDPEAEALLRTFEGLRAGVVRDLQTECARTGKSVLLRSVSDEQIDAAKALYGAYVEKYGLCSVLVAPLQVAGQLRTITLLRGYGAEPYGRDDQFFLQDFVDRAALAVDRATAYAAERDARKAAEQAAERTARIQTITASLSRAATTRDVAQVITEQVTAALGAVGAFLVMPVGGGAWLEVIGSAGLDPATVEAWGRFPADSAIPLAETLRTGEPSWPRHVADRTAHYPHLAEEYASAAGEAWMSLPLKIDGRVSAGLSLQFPTHRVLDEDEQAYALALGIQCAQAIERAQLYEVTQRYAHRVRALAEASRAFAAASLSSQAVYDAVARAATEIVADGCVVAVASEDGETLQLPAVHHSDPRALALLKTIMEQSAEVQRWEESLARAVATSGRPEVLLDTSARAFQDVLPLRLRPYLGEFPPRSILAVPLGTEERTLGALILLRQQQSPAYTTDDQALAQDLADRAALAIDNAVLYERAQQAIGIRNEFLSIAAHELKTPITSLLGTAQLTLRRLGKEGALRPEQLETALGTITRQSTRLSRLVDLLLDVSRLESGKLGLDPIPVNLAAFLSDVVAGAGERTEDHSFTLDIEADPVPASIDVLRMEQVLTNLFDNAIKFSPRESTIRVSLSTSGPKILLRVSDQGIGIPEEHRARIFDRFHQAHLSTHQSGMGLGLYITRQIVELHGGTIGVDFPEGGGTSFLITLPFAS